MISDKSSICSSLSEEIGSVFSFLTNEEVEDLCCYLEMKECSADQVLLKQGEAGEYLGFLLSGRLAVKKETGFPGKYVILAILEAGTMVGEIAAVLKWARSATVVALEDCKLLTMSVENMARVSEEKPALAIKLYKRIIYIISLRLRKSGERLSHLL